jgi:hypothetical protein
MERLLLGDSYRDAAIDSNIVPSPHHKKKPNQSFDAASSSFCQKTPDP